MGVNMNRSFLLISVAMLMIFAGATAIAGTVTIGSITGGTGTVTISSSGSPTNWTVSGGFSFDNTVSYGGYTLQQIFGAVPFTFGASSLANLSAYDGNGHDPSPHFKGNVGWLINNPYGPNAMFYGSTGSFLFSGAYPTGTVSATLNTNGFIHWYYGYDETVGPPAGETSLAAWGLNNPLNFNGTYTITGDTGNTITFNLTGDITTQVPEPSIMLLLGLGIGTATFAGWRRKK
jgi:hypothetical protein